MRTHYLLIALISMFSLHVFGQTNVSSLITGNQTWSSAGSPYIINQNTYIDTNARVLIQPGVEVTGNGYSLIIDGELQAIGHPDSMITIKNLEFQFKSGSADYNPSTGDGAFFKHCNIIGKSSVGTRCFMMNNTSMRLESCTVGVGYYGIYKTGSSSFDSSTIEIDSCVFYHQNPGNGYTLYHTGGDLHVENSSFTGGRNLYLTGEFEFNKNVVTDYQQIQLTARSNVEFRCNDLSRVSNGIRIATYSNAVGAFTFEDNTLDSFGNISSPQYYAMVDFSRPLTNSSMQFSIKNNNFMTYLGTVGKLEISGSNQSPGTFATLDFQNNYWNTTDTNQIKNMIHDYADDITIYAKADFSNYLDSMAVGCGIRPPCGKASYSYQTAGDTVRFTNESTGSGSVSWTFGDGSTSTDDNPTHVYSQAGSYQVCMTLYDADSVGCNEHCDTIEIKTASCQASFYVGLDSSHVFNLFIVNNSKGTSSNTTYSWDFGDGSTSSKKNPTHQYGSFGLYNLCLTISDGNCFSTYCDSIGLDSLGNLLKIEEGFTITVIDESDLNSIDERPIQPALVYPNPSNGQFTIELDGESSINQFTVVSMNGIKVPFSLNQKEVGKWTMTPQQINLPSGLYSILLHGSSGSYRATVLIK